MVKAEKRIQMFVGAMDDVRYIGINEHEKKGFQEAMGLLQGAINIFFITEIQNINHVKSIINTRSAVLQKH